MTSPPGPPPRSLERPCPHEHRWVAGPNGPELECAGYPHQGEGTPSTAMRVILIAALFILMVFAAFV